MAFVNLSKLTHRKTIYWRVQPKGLGINHYSTTSNEESGPHVGLFVFRVPCLPSDWMPDSATQEWVAIENRAGSWDCGDAEGFSIDPRRSVIVARFTVERIEQYLARAR